MKNSKINTIFLKLQKTWEAQKVVLFCRKRHNLWNIAKNFKIFLIKFQKYRKFTRVKMDTSVSVCLTPVESDYIVSEKSEKIINKATVNYSRRPQFRRGSRCSSTSLMRENGWERRQKRVFSQRWNERNELKNNRLREIRSSYRQIIFGCFWFKQIIEGKNYYPRIFWYSDKYCKWITL